MKTQHYLLLLPAAAIFALGLQSFQPNAIIYSVPEDFLPQFEDHQIDPALHTQLILDDKTVLHIPADAFVDLAGNVVEDPVTIQYKEFNNAADMAFSRIPMTYKGNCFNSSGMFEIQGHSDGQPVQIAPGKALKIDYQLAQKNPNTDFYRLNARNKQWELVSRIPQMADPNQPSLLDQGNPPPVYQPAPAPVEEVVLDEETEVIEVSFTDEAMLNDNPNWNRNLNVNTLNQRGINRGGNRKISKGLQKSYQVYADVVNDLSIAKFGVYNCDQVYRMENRIQLSAKYQDKAGNSIDDIHMLSLIDLNVNSAFSFSPTNFSCDAKGNNVLLLFSESGKLYLLDRGEFAKLKIKDSGSFTFTVKNMSAKIKGKGDLAKHLGLS